LPVRRLLALTVASVLLLGSAACGSDDPASPTAAASGETTGDLAAMTVDGTVGKELSVSYDGKVAVDQAESEVITKGEGNPAEANGAALLHLYIGNGTDGAQAINTYEQGPPVQVTLSEDQLFKPVLDALVGQPAGSRVAVAAPVKDVWGAQGQPQFKLKASDTAVFVADVISVQPTEVLDGPQGEQVDPPADAPKVIEKDGKVTGFDWSDAPKKAPEKLTVIPLVEGDGPVADAESIVTFDYFGEVYGADKPFDESYSREPVPFGVGVNGLIQAWDKAIPGLTRGSRVLIIAPPDTAYGDQDRPGIPGNSTLVFVVDVLGVDA
jgi:peptidylprolyl isomerase